MPNALLPGLPRFVVDRPCLDLSAVRLTSGASLMKRNYISNGFAFCSVVLHSSRSLHCKLSKRKSNSNENEEQFLAEIFLPNDYINSVDNFNGEDDKEMQRRRKIGLANKGKVPWNKGKKHDAETREKIKRRTREALSDPKVKKKMIECPRSHSNQTKARIGSSLRNLWAQRLKWKRSREAFLQSWAESIAIAAKVGGSGQEELDWDSEEKMEKEIVLEKLHWAAEKAKAKNIQAERKVQATAEKMKRLAHKRQEQGEKANNGGQSARKTDKKSKEEKEGLDVARELKIKAKLTKIHKKKTVVTSQERFQQQRLWEKFDLEFMKKEQLRKAISLEDQIRVARTERVKHATREALTTSSFCQPRDHRE